MEANNAGVISRRTPVWRRFARYAPKLRREYRYSLIVAVWMVATTLLSVVAGLWLDMNLGRGALYQFVTFHVPAPTPAQHAAWLARMLATTALPSLALAPLGPMLLRPVVHAPKRGLVILSASMFLSALMAYGQQWHTAFCSARGCSASGIAPLDAIGGLPLYRLAPAGIYGMRHMVATALTFFVLVAALLVGHDVVTSGLAAAPPDDSQKEIEAAMEAELDGWKVDDNVFGWHDTGVFDAVSDTGTLQETGYRIFAVQPRVTAKLAGVDLPEDQDGWEPPAERHFPVYDYTHSHGDA